MGDGPRTLRLRYVLAELSAAEEGLVRLGLPFMSLGADGLGRAEGLPPDHGEAVFWPEDDDQAAAILAQARENSPPPRSWVLDSFRPVDWVAAWRRWFHWSAASDSLAVGPPWEPPPEGIRVPVRIDPGEAFGTGNHPTTQLCLAMLEQAVTRLRDRGLPAPSVLDVGCGSGVLCVAARLLGAGDILGLDVDPPALDECARNALLNETAFRASLVPVEDLEGSWDVVLANILPAPLVALAPHLVARTSPGGLLILSGVLASDEGFPKRFLEACEGRMAFLEQRTHEGWWAGLLVSAMRP